MSGLLLLPLIGIDRWLGVLLGWQFAPLLSIVQGSTGENCRKAGWETNQRVKAARERVVTKWETADEKYNLRSRWIEFDARGKCTAFSEKHDLPGKWRLAAGVLVAKVVTPLKLYAKLMLAKLEDTGIAPRIRELWQRTGVPQWLSSQYKAFEDNQVLRARMRQIEIKERNSGFEGL